MRSSSKLLPVMGMIALGGLLAFVFSQVVQMRFSAGTMYPHYSTQRTDPLGGQAVFDSFDRLDSFSVSRNFLRYETLTSLDENSALILMGVPRQSVKNLRAKEDSVVLNAIKERGTRLILTIDPEIVAAEFTPEDVKAENDWFERRREIIRERNEVKPGKLKKEKSPESDPDKTDKDVESEKNEESVENSKKEKAGKEDLKDEKAGKKDKRDKVEKKVDDWLENEEELEEEAIEAFGLPLFDQWGLDFANVAAYERPESGWQPVAPVAAKNLGGPEVIPEWNSHLRFEVKSSDEDKWNVLAAIDGKPVVLERQFGKGSVVLASDSYFASNEGLHNGASPEFLLWLVGDKRQLVFDETIHGSQTSNGAMKLIKRYRMHGLFIGLFVFVALWAWKTATSLAPGSVEIDAGLVDGGAVTGEESSSGMVRLLRRSIPSKEVLSKCTEVWQASRNVALKPEEESGIARLVAENRNNPKSMGAITAYRRISDLLKKKV